MGNLAKDFSSFLERVASKRASSRVGATYNIQKNKKIMEWQLNLLIRVFQIFDSIGATEWEKPTVNPPSNTSCFSVSAELKLFGNSQDQPVAVMR